MSSEASERRKRAEERRRRATMRRTRLRPQEREFTRVTGPDALSLTTRLTIESWSLAGLPMPTYRRHETPYRFVRRGSS